MHISFRAYGQASVLELVKRTVRRKNGETAAKGKFSGGKTYGYRSVEGKKGEREIDAAEAEDRRPHLPRILRGPLAARHRARPDARPHSGTQRGHEIQKAAARHFGLELSRHRRWRAKKGIIRNPLYRAVDLREEAQRD